LRENLTSKHFKIKKSQVIKNPERERERERERESLALKNTVVGMTCDPGDNIYEKPKKVISKQCKPSLKNTNNFKEQKQNDLVSFSSNNSESARASHPLQCPDFDI
jgi:hypothetical protein